MLAHGGEFSFRLECDGGIARCGELIDEPVDEPTVDGRYKTGNLSESLARTFIRSASYCRCLFIDENLVFVWNAMGVTLVFDEPIDELTFTELYKTQSLSESLANTLVRSASCCTCLFIDGNFVSVGNAMGVTLVFDEPIDELTVDEHHSTLHALKKLAEKLIRLSYHCRCLLCYWILIYDGNATGVIDALGGPDGILIAEPLAGALGGASCYERLNTYQVPWISVESALNTVE